MTEDDRREPRATAVQGHIELEDCKVQGRLEPDATAEAVPVVHGLHIDQVRDLTVLPKDTGAGS